MKAKPVEKLQQFIQGNPDPRELKRALAVQMVQQDYRHWQIQNLLQVSSGFISKWTQAYQQQGAQGLRLQHKGSVGYLDAQQQQDTLNWLKQKNYWNLQELQTYVDEHHGVIFQSRQSYYELFHKAGISWKKTQKRNPRQNPELVEKKTGDYPLARGTT